MAHKRVFSEVWVELTANLGYVFAEFVVQRFLLINGGAGENKQNQKPVEENFDL